MAFSSACGLHVSAQLAKAKADAEYDKFKERTRNELTPVEIHFLEQFEREQKKLGDKNDILVKNQSWLWDGGPLWARYPRLSVGAIPACPKRCAYHGINYLAPFIMMRHWGELHQEGEYWCGEFETDEIDDKLAELIVNIQFACQRHYFGSLAEKFFDDKLRDASTNRRHRQRTIEEYNKLPDEFSIDDVARIFQINIYTARTRVRRLVEDDAIVKCGEYVENGTCKHRYKKKAVMVF